MRKRTINNIADKLFWLVVALLPLVLYALQFFAYELNAITDFQSFYDYMTNFGIIGDSVVVSALTDIFGVGGVLPMFSANSAPLLFLAWFVQVEIVHLAVDFLVFIPRLSHKFMDKITCTE